MELRKGCDKDAYGWALARRRHESSHEGPCGPTGCDLREHQARVPHGATVRALVGLCFEGS